MGICSSTETGWLVRFLHTLETTGHVHLDLGRVTNIMITVEHVTPAPPRITSHSRLSEIVEAFKAPEVKVTKQRGIQPWEKKARLNYHMKRMKMEASKAESPNLSLREIQTGKKDDHIERIILSLYTYFVGVAFIFFMLEK